jgi:hypothetical protein
MSPILEGCCMRSYFSVKSMGSTRVHRLSRVNRCVMVYPIAKISSNGSVVVIKQIDSGGTITVDTCTSQLLYEIQGPWYYNSDVTAVLNEISFEQLSSNRIVLHGVRSLPPPPTTKVGITTRGGF